MIKHDNPRLQNIILSKTQINNKEIWNVVSSIRVPTNYKTLKNKLVELFFEYKELLNHIGPEIESKYLLNFWFLEIIHQTLII